FRIGCPAGYEPNADVVAAARALGVSVEITHDPRAAAKGADVLYTDVWISMGQEGEAKSKANAFAGFTIDARLVQAADPNAVILHCLPAHYGEEITYEASRSPGSAIFDQAENRMHAQKAILALLMS
ncbi:MAG: ornithine carbamoyltransferase, partial [Candidatus Bipolaricaulota bacterium]|nr:ornithine carbamoyltransferase [Candidatus Bipolaricaulota bacterium]